MTPRAPALPPDQRRTAIIAAARPLLASDPTGFTTRQVAQAAGVAEGTIFRHFPSKDALVSAVVADLMDPTRTCEAISCCRATTLEDLVLQVLVILRDALAETFPVLTTLMTSRMDPGEGTAGTCPRATHQQHHAERSRHIDAAIITALAPFEFQFRLPLPVVAQYLRAIAFTTGIQHHTTPAAAPIAPDVLVRVLLHGLVAPSTDSSED